MSSTAVHRAAAPAGAHAKFPRALQPLPRAPSHPNSTPVHKHLRFTRCAAAATLPESPAAAAAAPAAAAAAAAELPLLLSGIRIVLVSPKTPANIGAVLRVAENFEAHDVVVVDPRCNPRCGEAAKTSTFSPLLDSMQVVPSMADALADCTGSIGFTRRAGGGRTVHASIAQLLARFPAAIPALLPAGCAAGGAAAAGDSSAAPNTAAGAAGAGGAAAAQGRTAAPCSAALGTVALVFGREESGLLESELSLCSHACAIPSGRAQPSLNLSHAAAVVLSQLFDLKQQQLMAADAVAAAAAAAGGAAAGEAGGPAPAPPPSVDPARAATGLMSGSLFESERVRWQREQALTAAPQAEVEALLARAAALLEAAGFSSKESSGGGNRSNHGRKRQLMGHVRALLLRGQASTAEIRALHGLCKELEGRQRAIGGGGAS